MTEITLDVRGNGPGVLKFEWRSPAAGGAMYEVDEAKLKNRARDVRDRLKDVIAAAMNPASKPLQVGLELKALARAGRSLRNRIFLAQAGEHQGEDQLAENWLASLDAPILHVTIDRKIYIPWGLAYDGDPELLPDDPADISPAKYADFWCIKYGLSTLYNRIRDPIRKPRPAGQAQIVNLINSAVWDQAFQKLPAHEQTMTANIFTMKAVSSRQAFEQLWRVQKKCMETDLLYFFGHASGTAISFGKNDLLDLEGFDEVLRRIPPQSLPACIVFLNGCHTAIGDDQEGGFLEATGLPGFYGFVGTEAEIPDVFALRFANSFVGKLLFTGDKALDVMKQLRQEFWPFSLAYNLSCHPEFRFDTKGMNNPPPLPPPPDFSKEPIGSRTV